MVVSKASGALSPKDEMPRNLRNLGKFVCGMIWKFKGIIARRIVLCGSAAAVGFHFLGPWGILAALPVIIVDIIVSKKVSFGSFRVG